MNRRKLRRPPEGTFTATIHDLTHDGRGVAHINQKTTFITNALPGETIEFNYTLCKGKFDEGKAVRIIEASSERVTPPCPHTERCGGCSMQHLNPATQRTHKEQLLRKDLAHFGQLTPDALMPPIISDALGYRTKARLSVRYVPGKDLPLVGFREKHSRFVTEITQCPVLDNRVGPLIMPLRQLIALLSCPNEIPQIEIAAGDEEVALIFRHLVPFSDDDLTHLRHFGQMHQLRIYLQPKGPDTIHLIDTKECPLLHYRLPHYSLTLQFHPSDFTQVNMAINRQLIDKVIELLRLTPDDIVLDLFCGLGNFTLPIATRAKHVVGVEGNTTMTQRASMNAQANGLHNVEFHTADLSTPFIAQSWLNQDFTKLLLDPPRSGALEVVQSLKKLDTLSRIVYVSCNPATLARDIGILVNTHGFILEKTGILDMFPHTSHVESIALLTR